MAEQVEVDKIHDKVLSDHKVKLCEQEYVHVSTFFLICIKNYV